jgi:methylthioribose-1-phosphate isomerase
VSEYEEVKNAEDGWEAIRSMKVRGAPAIAIAGALSLAVEAHRILAADTLAFADAAAAADFLVNKLEYLKTSRPTAVNLFEAADRLTRLARSKATTAAAGQEGARQVFQAYIAEAEKFVTSFLSLYSCMLSAWLTMRAAVDGVSRQDARRRHRS